MTVLYACASHLLVDLPLFAGPALMIIGAVALITRAERRRARVSSPAAPALSLEERLEVRGLERLCEQEALPLVTTLALRARSCAGSSMPSASVCRRSVLPSRTSVFVSAADSFEVVTP